MIQANNALKSLILSLLFFSQMGLYAQINWIGNLNSSGDGGVICESSDYVFEFQVFKNGVTEAPGQGSGIQAIIRIHTSTDGDWTNGAGPAVIEVPAYYNGDIGNNDIYRASLAESGIKLTTGRYSYEAVASDDGFATELSSWDYVTKTGELHYFTVGNEGLFRSMIVLGDDINNPTFYDAVQFQPGNAVLPDSVTGGNAGGNFCAEDDLFLLGGEVNIFKNNSCGGNGDITSATLWYNVDGGAFSPLTLPFFSSCCGGYVSTFPLLTYPCGGPGGSCYNASGNEDQQWGTQTNTTNLIDLVGGGAGPHTLQFYFEITTAIAGSITDPPTAPASYHAIDFTIDPGLVNGCICEGECLDDKDNDGIIFGEESIYGTSDGLADTDGDGIDDRTELYGPDNDINTTADNTDPLDPCDPFNTSPTCDIDMDGLTNAQEVTYGTSPFNPDSDGDTFPDGEEAFGPDGIVETPEDNTNPTDPCDPSITTPICDFDMDGLTYSEEINAGTDPMLLDTDGDGLADAYEFYGPDGMPNTGDETDPLNACDPSIFDYACDIDMDGLTNGEEIVLGTIVEAPDSDGDGILDGAEVTAGSDPLDTCDPDPLAQFCDQDEDGLDNAQEASLGTNPTNPDTDGDGISDGLEAEGLDEVIGTGDNETNPLDPCDPDPSVLACTDSSSCVLHDYYTGTITPQVYQTGSTIGSNGLVAIGTDVSFLSNCIALDPQFEVKLGAEFLADIDPCAVAFTANITLLEKSNHEKTLTINQQHPDAKFVKILLKNKDGNIEKVILDQQHPRTIQEMAFDISDVPTGVYFLVLKTSHKEWIEKIVIE